MRTKIHQKVMGASLPPVPIRSGQSTTCEVRRLAITLLLSCSLINLASGPTLTPVSQKLFDALVSGTLTTGETWSALKRIRYLPSAESTDLWTALKAELSPEIYGIMHRAYLEGILKHRWGIFP